VPHHEPAPRIAVEDEVNFLPVVPGGIERCRRDHRPRRRRPWHDVADETCDQGRLEPELLVVRDVLPRAPAACRTDGRGEVLASRRDPVRRGRHDFERRRDDAAIAPGLYRDSYALAGNRQRNGDRRTTEPRDAIASGRVDVEDVDDFNC